MSMWMAPPGEWALSSRRPWSKKAKSLPRVLTTSGPCRRGVPGGHSWCVGSSAGPAAPAVVTKQDQGRAKLDQGKLKRLAAVLGQAQGQLLLGDMADSEAKVVKEVARAARLRHGDRGRDQTRS
eukprot:6465674-Amphidinium_carterae.1